jgi:hypothetical protein
MTEVPILTEQRLQARSRLRTVKRSASTPAAVA